MDIKIERLKKEDIEKTKEFLFGIIKDDFGYEFNPVWHKDITDLESLYLENENSNFLVAKIENEIVGTIAVRPYDKDYPEFKDKYSADNTISIWRHYIKKELRGQRIGSRLLSKIEKFSKEKGFKYTYLHTQRTIPWSAQYWQLKGFKITYEPGDELQTVHMEKVIT